MAWSVPAIAVAASVPAYAASQGVVTFTGRGCKDPGNSIPGVPGSKRYFAELEIRNETASPITVNFVNAVVNGATAIEPPGFQATPFTTIVPASTLQTIVVRFGNWADSANATIVLVYSIGGEAGTAETRFVATPPINGASCPLTYPSVSDTPL